MNFLKEIFHEWRENSVEWNAAKGEDTWVLLFFEKEKRWTGEILEENVSKNSWNAFEMKFDLDVFGCKYAWNRKYLT